MKIFKMGVAGGMVCLAVFFYGCSPTIKSKQEQPNIVWLVTEDNSHHWNRLYSEFGAVMPNVQRLAENGLVFNHAFSNAPVCSTARSTIISGCYISRLGAQHHRTQRKMKMPEGIRMFPWYLRQAGYYTSNNAKEDYNFLGSEKEGVWDESSSKASYRKRVEGQAFFHVQNFGHTHEGRLFKGVPDSELKTDPAGVKLFPYHPNTPTFRNRYALYLDKHQEVDVQLGEFIDQLEADGVLDDTFVFYYGDHGGVLPGSKGYAYNDGLQVPMVVYVPKNWQHLIPAQRGSRIDGFVEFVDLSATVLNLAGIKIPDGIDGEPFLGNGVGLEELNGRNTSFSYAERFDEKLDMVRTLRRGKFHYMRSYQPFNFDGLHAFYRYKQPAFVEWWQLYQAGKLNSAQSRFFEPRMPEALYDLDQDPHEVNNLADDPAYAEVLAEMRQLLQERMKSLPDLGLIPEPVLVSESGGDGYVYALEQQERIIRLLEIADLQLIPFSQAQSGMEAALQSEDPLERYWGLITCATFGADAAAFYPLAKTLAQSDPDRLVRVRAAEFLGLTKQVDPQPVIMEVLSETTDPIEANLILNTVTLLRDGKASYPFDLSGMESAAWNSEEKNMQVGRRMEYLTE